jgi:hypothetical protein
MYCSYYGSINSSNYILLIKPVSTFPLTQVPVGTMQVRDHYKDSLRGSVLQDDAGDDPRPASTTPACNYY